MNIKNLYWWADEEGALRTDALAAPNACALCGRDPRAHGNIFTRPYGAHTWVRPSSDLVKARILSRRSS